MQPPRAHGVLHGSTPDPDLAQLRARQHPTLSPRQRRRPQPRGWSLKCIHAMRFRGHPPRVPGNSRQRTPQTQQLSASAHTPRCPSRIAARAPRPISSRPWQRSSPSEADIVAVGRDLAAALPGASRNPLKAMDDKAMDLASQDADLRAALFRFVDVVPACRSLDDLARHLSGFLEEVDDRPPSLQVAMRMSESRAGRQALGAAAAAGVKHMAHRFIVGETPREAHRRARGALEARRRHERRPARRGDGHERRGRPLRRALPRGARRARRGLSQAPRAPVARSRQRRAHPAREPVGQGLGPHPAAAARRPRARQARRRGAPRDLLRRARELDAHLHIDMESFDSREAVTDLVLELLSEDEFRDGPSAGFVLQAYLRDSPQLCDASSTGPQSTPRGYPAARAPRQGRLLGPRDRRGPPARLGVAGLRGQGRLRPQLRGAHAAPARRRGRPSASPSRATTCAPSPTPSPPAGAMGGDDARRRGPGPPRPGRRPPGGAGQARPAGAHLLPGRRPRGRHGLPGATAAREHEQRVLPARAGAPAVRSTSCSPRHDRPADLRQRADRRAAPRVGARRAQRRHGERSSASSPLEVPVWIGGRRAPRRRARLDRSRPPRPSRRPRCLGHRRRGRRGGASRRPRVHASGRRPRPPERAEILVKRRRLDARAPAPSWPRSRSASAPSPGPRPTATSARPSTSSSSTPAARSRSTAARRSSRSPASATRCATRPRGVVAVIAPWNFPHRDPAWA